MNHNGFPALLILDTTTEDFVVEDAFTNITKVFDFLESEYPGRATHRPKRSKDKLVLPIASRHTLWRLWREAKKEAGNHPASILIDLTNKQEQKYFTILELLVR